MKSNDGRLKSVKQSELLPFVFGLVVFFMASVQLEAQESTTEDDSTEQEAFFENKIRPLLAQKCAECHGAEKQESDFRVDNRASIFAGGASG
ncbi:MAG: c-type cytochrome domain-containing protein, partial [Planctomycetota bacterium]|nr:c-type cytochrome domain-containing protein [Planctomycetota bacterium]